MKMDMNKAREILHLALKESECTFEFKRGRCWVSSERSKVGFRFHLQKGEIHGFKIGRKKVLFGNNFKEKLIVAIKEK